MALTSPSDWPRRPTDATLVTEDILLQVLDDVDPPSAEPILRHEPVLVEYLEITVMDLLTQLSQSGVEPFMLNTVCRELHLLLGVVGLSLRAGYAELLKNFLPAESVDLEDISEEEE